MTKSPGLGGVPPNPPAARIRAALVNPPDPCSSDNSRLLPPLGLGYIASVARLRGHHVDVFDLALEVNPPLNLLQAKGIFDSYDVYGFSTYSDTVTNTVALASRIKQQCPDAL